MRIQKMNETLLEINQMKELISVDYKDIYYNGPQEKRKIMPGFLVFYGNLKHLFLTVADPYFEDFVRRLKEVYKLEQDKVLQEGILGEERISITPFTKSLLLNGDLDTTSSLYQFYKGKTSYEESLLFESDKRSTLIPIIEYHLKETMKLLDKTLGEIHLSEGINNSFYLKTIINNTPMILPITIEEISSNEYLIQVGNLLDSAIPLKMKITFTKDGIHVRNEIQEYQIVDETQFVVSEFESLQKRDIYKGNKLIVYEDKRLNPKKNPIENTTALDNQEQKMVWYSLPWDAYLGVKEDIKYLREDGEFSEEETKDRMTTKRVAYASRKKDTFLVKEMMSKRYEKRSETIMDAKNVVFDYLNKTIIGLKQETGYIIETSFEGPAKTGFYKTNLDGKHFYHIARETNLENLQESSLIPLSREDGLEENVDLLDIKKYEKK